MRSTYEKGHSNDAVETFKALHTHTPMNNKFIQLIYSTRHKHKLYPTLEAFSYNSTFGHDVPFHIIATCHRIFSV